MKIIISEKAIAGRRIAEILANKKVPMAIEDRAQFFAFEANREQYLIIPLRGHIVDVDFPKKYAYWMGTDLMKLIKANVEYIGKEKSIIGLLKKKAKDSTEVIIATDNDREGEAIGVEVLRYIIESNPKISIKRALFSAITPKDIQTAFSNLGEVNYNFAASADARREIDLIWGAVLTRFFSIISGRMGKEFLSSGRVQTPTLGLIVNREKKRQAFESKKYWIVNAIFEKEKKPFEAEHKEGKFWEKEKADAVMKNTAKQGTVKKITETKRVLKKPAPFNTTDFLRAAASIGINPSEAMNIAESLYMEGYMSYPRTDNTVYPKNLYLNEILNNLASNTEFGRIIEEIKALGPLNPSRGKKETTDHPPIHPVTNAPIEKLSDRKWKIYELVCRRFFATLGEDAETMNQSIKIDLDGEEFIARGQKIKKEGWKKFYPYSTIKEVILPAMKENDLVDLTKLNIDAKETQPPTRYSQGSLIKLMEENGLGTKSTRHETIKKLYSRSYISGVKAIEPNKIGIAVIDSLNKYDVDIAKPVMTADTEKQMDLIVAGKKTKEEVVTNSREMLTNAMTVLMKERNQIGSILRDALRADSLMVPCTRCEGSLRMLRGRTGKRFLGCTNYPKCTETYPLPQKGKIIPLEPVCKTCKKPMIRVFMTPRRKYEMCIDPKCPSKANWGKKKPADAKK